MTQVQKQIVQVLSDLLAAEQQGILHHLGELGAFVGVRQAGLSRPMADMAERQQQNEAELSEIIESHGGLTPPMSVNMGMQSLAYLSVDFLLPQLIEAKKQTITRYERALAAAGEESAEGNVLSRHLAGHRQDLARLAVA